MNMMIPIKLILHCKFSYFCLLSLHNHLTYDMQDYFQKYTCTCDDFCLDKQQQQQQQNNKAIIMSEKLYVTYWTYKPRTPFFTQIILGKRPQKRGD